MRISDWSSDVCSSDLGGPHPSQTRHEQRPDAACPRYPHPKEARQDCLADAARCLPVPRLTPCGPVRSPRHPASPDRKSVVTGKSVSVRVDLGGRRIIQKKNHIYYIYFSFFSYF